MVYDHAVIKNGILYATGTEVPSDVNVGKSTEHAAEKIEEYTEQKQPVRRGRPPKKE